MLDRTFTSKLSHFLLVVDDNDQRPSKLSNVAISFFHQLFNTTQYFSLTFRPYYVLLLSTAYFCHLSSFGNQIATTELHQIVLDAKMHHPAMALSYNQRCQVALCW